MKGYKIVIGEEKTTIRSLVMSAVNGKPKDKEKIERVFAVSNEMELLASVEDVEKTIILLSTTFTEKTHAEMIKQLLSLYPAIHIITLTHKYGDRSSLEYGAYESVDKPIRNPVLWKKLDKTIEHLETSIKTDERMSSNDTKLFFEEENNIKKSQNDIDDLFFEENDTHVDVIVNKSTKDVLNQKKAEKILNNPIISQDSDDLDTDLLPNINEKKESVSSISSNNNDIVVVSDGDDFLDDDLFGEKESIKATQKQEVESRESPPDVDIEPPLVQHQKHFEQNSTSNKATSLVVQPSDDIYSDDSMDSVGFEFDDEPSDMNTPIGSHEEQDVLTNENEPEKAVVELTTKNNSNKITKETPLKSEIILSEEEDDEVEHHSDVLEPAIEIFEETSNYNEKSEWTLAKEGFVNFHGRFVSLEPPRDRMNKHLSNHRRALLEKPSEVLTTEKTGLFGSVKNLLKKK